MSALSARRSFASRRPPRDPAWCVPTNPGPWRWPATSPGVRGGDGGSGGGGRHPDLRHRYERRHPHRGRGARSRRRGLLASPGRPRLTTVWLRVPGLHNVRNATAALTHGAGPRGPLGERAPRPCGTITAWPGASSGGANGPGSPSSTTTAIFRARWRRRWRDRHRSVGPGGRGLPTPPLFTHRGPLAGLRRRFRGRRRGGRDRHLPGRRAGPTGCERPPDRRRRSRCAIPTGTSATRRPSTTPPPSWRESFSPGICASPSAPAT